MKLPRQIPCTLCIVFIVFTRPALGDTNSLDPLLPAPVQTTNLVALSDAEQLGKDIFFDSTLSNPSGYSCATCHIPQSGFTGPSSYVNQVAGPVPGVIPGRLGKRKPQSIGYSTFSPEGPLLVGSAEGGTYIGGHFWDGRAPDIGAQSRMPFLDQNEMANTPVGAFPPHAGGYSPLVASKLTNRPYTQLFRKVFGQQVFETNSPESVYNMMAAVIATYESSTEVNPFSSKFDASENGTPPMNLYTFTPSEQNGMDLFFDKAQCSACHDTMDPVPERTQGRQVFTMYCFANIGVPRNPGNPIYTQTNCDTNPQGCNSLGTNFIDLGLGANPNPAPDGRHFFNVTPGDIGQFRGIFKAPSLRNVDLRPYPGFVKSYMHNGVFKSLEEVVHFYNKRNIATNAAGDEVSFPLFVGPPPGYTAIFAPAETTDNAQNLYGYTPDQAANSIVFSPFAFTPFGQAGELTHIPFNGQIGHLELTAQEETDIVNFLKTLTDGYMSPNPLEPVLAVNFTAVTPQPTRGTFVVQLTGQGGQNFVLQSSTNLTDWLPVSTNVFVGPSLNLTNVVTPGAASVFWRVVPGG